MVVLTYNTIRSLKSSGHSNDIIYQLGAAKAELFGKAFFGQSSTRAEKRRLERMWRRIIRVS